MNLITVKNTGISPNFGNNSVIKTDKTTNTNKNHKEAENPISKKGEKVVLFSGALISAMGVTIKGLYKMSCEDTDGSLGKSFNEFINKIIQDLG